MPVNILSHILHCKSGLSNKTAESWWCEYPKRARTQQLSYTHKPNTWCEEGLMLSLSQFMNSFVELEKIFQNYFSNAHSINQSINQSDSYY